MGVSAVSGLLFVGLNIVDAWLTKQLLAMGGRELNPIVITYGENMLIKGLIALAVVLLLIKFGKKKLLGGLNFCMLAVVLWNGMWLI